MTCCGKSDSGSNTGGDDNSNGVLTRNGMNFCGSCFLLWIIIALVTILVLQDRK